MSSLEVSTGSFADFGSNQDGAFWRTIREKGGASSMGVAGVVVFDECWDEWWCRLVQ